MKKNVKDSFIMHFLAGVDGKNKKLLTDLRSIC